MAAMNHIVINLVLIFFALSGRFLRRTEGLAIDLNEEEERTDELDELEGFEDKSVELMEILKEKNDASKRLPEEMEVAFEFDDKLVTLSLTKNRNVPPDAPVFISDGSGRGTATRWTSDSDQPFATYSDFYNQASIVVDSREEDDGKTVRNFRGTVAVDGNQYLVEPRDGPHSRSSSETDERLVEIDGINHVMTMERAELEFDDLHGPHDPASTSEKNVEQELLDAVEEFADSKLRAGFDKYVVEMFLVLDYALFNRWHSRSKAADETGKKNDAIKHLQYYFAHVASGVDMRYANIKESDFSVNVRLVGYYIATTPADSQWTEGPGIKIIHNGLGYSNMYKGLEAFEKWLGTTYPKLGVTFDQATLFSGNNLFDGNYKDDGSPMAKSGLAEIEGICHLKSPRSLSASINRELGVYSSIQTAAHEMGHNLGSQHDSKENGCEGADQYIMASAPRVLTAHNFDNPYRFSKCSVSYFRKYLPTIHKKHTVNCLLVHSSAPTVTASPHLKPYPGAQFPVDEQCQNIYGLTSFYCAGGTNDHNLCHMMQCWIPQKKVCFASAEQRAFIGTSCGNKKWCQLGKCVADSKAVATHDTCVYGDYKAPFPLDATTTMSCAEMGKVQPWRCYENRTKLECCDTCVKVLDKTKPAGCEYGDKDPTYCKSKSLKSYCYDKSFASTCCVTCAKLKGTLAGCEYGDKAAWCATLKPSQCYDSSAICCEACPKIKKNIPGCEFGDKAPWCATTKLSAALCKHGNTATQCCVGCKPFAKDEQEELDDACSDTIDWCPKMFPGWCYTPSMAKVCCLSCKGFKKPNADCPFGDRFAWCGKDRCAKNKKDCCASCA